jgi:hypothetical protein
MSIVFSARKLAVAFAVTWPLLGVAQQPHGAHAAPAAASAPASKAAPAARRPFDYQSAFEGFRGHADERPVPWREANDNVGRIGGWRVYAREAAAAGKPAGASSPAASNEGGRGARSAP